MKNIKNYLEGFISHGIPYVMLFIVAILLIKEKCGYHVDEIWSYGLANHPDGIWINVEDGIQYDNPEEPFLRFVTVDPNHRFDYINVWNNQRADVHPPFYYLILHTICSFFPGIYSDWFAGCINIFFVLLTLYAVRRLLKGLVGNEPALIALGTLLFIFSCGILNMVVFFRMYMMAMFWVTQITAVVIEQLNTEQKHFEIKVALLTVAGTLTHYYCLFYFLLLFPTFICILVYQKRNNAAFRLLISETCAGAASLIIFPGIMKHLFKEFRGREAFDNLLFHFDSFRDRMKHFFDILDQQVAGSILRYILIIVLLSCVYWAVSGLGLEISTVVCQKMLILFIPTTIFFVLVSKMSPFFTGKYLSPVYANIICGLLCMTYFLLKRVFRITEPYAALVVFSAVILVNGFGLEKIPALQLGHSAHIEKIKQYENLNCLCIYTDQERWKLQDCWEEIKNYNSVVFLSVDNLNKLSKLDMTNDEEIMVVVTNECDDLSETILEAYPKLESLENIGSFGSSVTFHYF